MKDHFRQRGDEEKKAKQTSQGSVLSLIRQILSQSVKYKLVVLVGTVAYLVVYGYSSGAIFYTSFDVTPYLKQTGLSNPYFISFRNLSGLYYSGMVWFPTSHSQLSFLVGPTFSSIILSVLFGLSILLLIYSLRFRVFKRRQGFVGLIGMLPALFGGGCCAVPIATLLLGSIVPSTILFKLEFGDPLLLDLLIAALMLFSILYTGKKILRTRNSCEA